MQMGESKLLQFHQNINQNSAMNAFFDVLRAGRIQLIWFVMGTLRVPKAFSESCLTHKSTALRAKREVLHTME